MDKTIKDFQKLVWNFYKKNKRNLPWRETHDPYKILVSEVMLQQTQADRVVPFYERWIQRFPNVKTLAKANFSQIYPFWKGLGYNRRALALQKLARVVLDTHQGKLPLGLEDLQALPGIGPYTARAISIFAYNRPLTCIETNIRRVFIHHFFADKNNITDKEILEIAERACPAKPEGRSREWHWALMDYGAMLGTTLSLSKGGNPNRRHKNYAIQSKFEGSLRQVRGRVLKSLADGPKNSRQLKAPKAVLQALEKEGFIRYNPKKKTYLL